MINNPITILQSKIKHINKQQKIKKLQKRLNKAYANDRSHVSKLSENE